MHQYWQKGKAESLLHTSVSGRAVEGKRFVFGVISRRVSLASFASAYGAGVIGYWTWNDFGVYFVVELSGDTVV